MLPLKDILSKKIKASPYSDQIENSLVLEEFSNAIKSIIGSNLPDKVRPLYIKNKTITVACLSPVLGQELKLQEKKIITKINKKFNSDIVFKIRFLL